MGTGWAAGRLLEKRSTGRYLGVKSQTIGRRTPEGKARQIKVNTIRGRETRAIREGRSAKLSELYEIEK
jgi:hypothetical protein|tara:strand:+ start:1361 stop:1567 length:207 start_codon:yes stop_codon:yes gene_type:complete